MSRHLIKKPELAGPESLSIINEPYSNESSVESSIKFSKEEDSLPISKRKTRNFPLVFDEQTNELKRSIQYKDLLYSTQSHFYQSYESAKKQRFQNQNYFRQIQLMNNIEFQNELIRSFNMKDAKKR